MARTAGYVRQLTAMTYQQQQAADEFVAKIGRAIMFDGPSRPAMLQALANDFVHLNPGQKSHVMARAIPAITNLAVILEIASIFGPRLNVSY